MGVLFPFSFSFFLFFSLKTYKRIGLGDLVTLESDPGEGYLFLLTTIIIISNLDLEIRMYKKQRSGALYISSYIFYLSIHIFKLVCRPPAICFSE